MKKKRDHGDLIALALCVSVVLHALVMFFAAPRVMSRTLVSGYEARRDRRPPMTVKRHASDPLRTRGRTVPENDAPAPKSAPAAESETGVPEAGKNFRNASAVLAPRIAMPEIISAPDAKTELPEPSAAAAPAAPDESTSLPPPSFSPELPGNAGTPSFAGIAEGGESLLPEPGAPAPQPVFKITEAASDAGNPMAGLDSSRPAPKSDYVFNNKVLDTVDTVIVEKEKAAVKELLSVPDAEAMETAAECTLYAGTDPAEPQWRYFKIVFSPKRGVDALNVVPKDAVIIMDASGSIGSDRITRCRNATKAILRSCLNSGDRFNLVAFRNRFSYAFREWRECDAISFEAADRWLSRLTAHGRTDVFSTISSVLTLPRDPARPVIALVITDGDANVGVKETAEILSRFTALNDGLISVYMYGVKREANVRLIDLLTRGNRGESFVHTGSRRRAARELEPLAQAFRDPVLTDLRLQFAAGSGAQTYPRLLKNLYKNRTVEVYGRCPANVKELIFSLKGLSGAKAYDSLYRLRLDQAFPAEDGLPAKWRGERAVAELIYR